MQKIITYKGMSWEIGMRWGDHHLDPANKDWYGEEAVSIVDNNLHLDILNIPKYFDDIKAKRLFCSGCISSLEQVHHGLYHFEYTLPLGRHIWPAIWMYSAKQWPPEIDIMEGWTGCKSLFGNVRRNYRRHLPWKNSIYPSLHYKEDGSHKCMQLHDGLLKGSMAYKQPTNQRCSCDMLWDQDCIDILYNGFRVARFTDKKVLALLDEPMTIILDLFCDTTFSMQDYEDYRSNGRDFTIHDLSYNPF